MKRLANSGNQRRDQRGIALLEALVGMLIFAFGVLGLIGLQASMTQAQTSAHFRADASNLASDLFGLIETDSKTNFASYNDANCAGYSRCADWLRKVAAELPSGQATMTSTPSIPSGGAAGSTLVTVALSVSWAQGADRNNFTTSMTWVIQ